jgi:short-subunit dehydrogenase
MSRREIRRKTAIVTGATSGIGRAIAVELARHGARLVLLGRREDRLREVAGEITALGSRAEVVPGDVTDAAVRAKVVQTAVSQFGGLDILVNNAGIGALGRFEDADPARLRQIMEVNFFAAVELTRLALRVLKRAHRAIIVNVGSILGHRGVPWSSEYCASKFALRGFSEALRAELSRHGIDVLLVSPGTTQTEFSDHLIERKGEPGWGKRGQVSAEHVARKTVQAICRGDHEVIPSNWAKLIWLGSRLLPRWMDYVLSRYA